MKDKLTFWQKIWQKIQLHAIWLMWIKTDPNERKTWHEVKKGMEKHDHKFTKLVIYKGFGFMQCEHEGCNLCIPVR